MPKTLQDLKQQLLSRPQKQRLGVVAAQDAHTLEAVAHASAYNLIDPILIGDETLITSTWKQVTDAALPEIIHKASIEDCISIALRMVLAGKLSCIMKGKVETGALMKSVVNKETGIGLGGILSIVAVMESPYYHKLFAVTDVGLLTYPNLEQLKGALQNATVVMRSIGVDCPKVAVLAAVEKVNPKMPETVNAAELKRMQQDGELADCLVEGPIYYDLCMDPEAAAVKGYDSPVAGDPDILVVPDIVSGNLLSKSLTCTGGAKTCGIVCGAKVPIVLTSRSATAEDKYMSIVLSALVGSQTRE